MLLMRSGRVRWKVENETFDTLKNQGYHFEHNFGHGKKHLSTVFAHLMMLPFLIDQIQEHYFSSEYKTGTEPRFGDNGQHKRKYFDG